jgi:hypothetical protein
MATKIAVKKKLAANKAPARKPAAKKTTAKKKPARRLLQRRPPRARPLREIRFIARLKCSASSSAANFRSSTKS